MTTSTAFRERLVPSAAVWALVPVAGAMAFVSFYPVGAGVAAAVGGIVAVAVAVGLWRLSPTVAVEGGELVAGRARIPLTLLGSVEVIGPGAVSAAMGPGLDARAHVVHRGWVRAAVRIGLRDPGDPTPYWLVSTRRPQELADALMERGAQAAHSEQTG